MSTTRHGNLKCLLFTFQNLSPASRKTGMTFLAEALAGQGNDVRVVTVHMSWLSKLAGAPRFKNISREPFNAWVIRSARLQSYVWLPFLHPVRGKGALGKMVWTALAKLYSSLLPRELITEAAQSDVIVIESCVAIVLFPHLKKAAPRAKFIYCASDRLDVVGMPPELSEALNNTIAHYDLVRVPAEAMLDDFGPAANVKYLPHGLDHTTFDAVIENPYPAGSVNAVVAGDMSSDIKVIVELIDAFPAVHFHLFGKLDEKLIARSGNVTHHGEVGFQKLAGYIKYADVGLAPYSTRHRSEYLAQSSLKLLQYSYCRLPVIAPEFVKGQRVNVMAYDPDSRTSIVNSMQLGLNFDRSEFSNSDIRSWSGVCDEMLSFLDFPPDTLKAP